ncbi:effector-associated constant component EACC1 [Saccharothrix isguenensis]
MEIELRFEAGEVSSGSHDDLRTLYRHLADNPELREDARVSIQREPVRPGEMGATEVVLAMVATAAALGQLAVAIRAWRDQLKRPTSVRLVVSDEHREPTRAVSEALCGPEEARPGTDGARAVGAGPIGRIDPDNSACVLIGVDTYYDQELPSLRAVYNNVEQLHDVLTDENIWGVKTGRIRKVHNPRTPTELVQPIREMSELATDTLIVYYSGHGLKDLLENELYLALPNSVPGQPESAVRYKAIKQAITQSRQARRVVVILDCCYSGVVIDGGMSAATDDIRADAGVEDVRGSYLMCSAAPNRKALAPSADVCTVFTGELVDVLGRGIPEGTGLMISLGAVFREVRRRLKRDNRPEPQEQDQNQVGDLHFAHNLARQEKPVSEVTVPAPRTRRQRVLRRLGLATVVVVAAAAGFAAQLGVDWWRGLRAAAPVPAGGQCSPNATLLSYSDQLDKVEVSGERVTGLSALAFTGRSSVLVLADNEPGRVFPLTLENPQRLEVSIGIGRTLRDPDGAPYTGGIDGEGLVIEHGTGTMLVSSEDGPTIRRFQISNGREVGEPVVVPTVLRNPPVGDAQNGRTIEALTATPEGDHLYAGWEAPLNGDGDQRGRNRLRIQRYLGEPGGTYTPDRQYAYETDAGLYLTELAFVERDRLLALERQYVEGLGNAVRVYDVRLADTEDVTDDPTLSDNTADVFSPRTLLFDLADCPAGSPGQVAVKEPQPNPLLGNVEGMAVGPEETTGPEKGTRLLYLVTDDNSNSVQITRLYAFRITLPD